MDPMANWDEKYRADSGRPLATEKVALYGSQILQVINKVDTKKSSHSVWVLQVLAPTLPIRQLFKFRMLI